MEKRKINVNRPEVSPSEISSRLNFQSVLSGHAAVTTPWYQTTGFLASSIGVVVIAGAALVYYVSTEAPILDPNSTPIANVDPDYTYQPDVAADDYGRTAFYSRFVNDVTPKQAQTFAVIAEEGGTFDYTKTGTQIWVPANAFLGSDGEEITGQVHVKYIEYHNQAEIFMSGIPMTYDSANHRYHFESAGMLEIMAYQNGIPLLANPKVPISINMQSGNESTQFSIYQYDDELANWVFKGKDQVTPNPAGGELLADNNEGATFAEAAAFEAPEFQELTDVEIATPAQQQRLKALRTEMNMVADEIAEIENSEPKKPMKADHQRHRFNLDYNVEEFPELEVYTNTMFELGDHPENNDFNTDLYQIEWEDMLLSEHNKGISYMLTLIKGSERKSFVVYPVFEGVNHDQALKTYQKKFDDYKLKLEIRVQEEQDKKGEFDRIIDDLRSQNETRAADWRAELQVQRAAYDEAESSRQEQLHQQVAMANAVERRLNKVTRAFTISEFGVWNSDNPNQLPEGANVHASFQTSDGQTLHLNEVYLVQKDINALFQYFSSDFANFSFDPSKENMIWAITEDNELAVVRANGFADASGDFTFTMQLTDKKLRSIEDVKAYLDI
jgi:hypothetical protein